MSLLTDIIIGVPIGIVLNIFIHQLSYVLYNDLPYKEKFQKSLLTLFIVGILSLTLAFTLFSNHSIYKNRIMKFGFITGGALLIFYSIFYNWSKMEDWTKLIIFGLILGGLIFYCYKQSKAKAEELIKAKRNKKNKKNKHVKKPINMNSMNSMNSLSKSPIPPNILMNANNMQPMMNYRRPIYDPENDADFCDDYEVVMKR